MLHVSSFLCCRRIVDRRGRISLLEVFKEFEAGIPSFEAFLAITGIHEGSFVVSLDLFETDPDSSDGLGQVVWSGADELVLSSRYFSQNAFPVRPASALRPVDHVLSLKINGELREMHMLYFKGGRHEKEER